jgi:hypothetical protein
MNALMYSVWSLLGYVSATSTELAYDLREYVSTDLQRGQNHERL